MLISMKGATTTWLSTCAWGRPRAMTMRGKIVSGSISAKTNRHQKVAMPPPGSRPLPSSVGQAPSSVGTRPTAMMTSELTSR